MELQKVLFLALRASWENWEQGDTSASQAKKADSSSCSLDDNATHKHTTNRYTSYSIHQQSTSHNYPSSYKLYSWPNLLISTCRPSPILNLNAHNKCTFYIHTQLFWQEVSTVQLFCPKPYVRGLLWNLATYSFFPSWIQLNCASTCKQNAWL